MTRVSADGPGEPTIEVHLDRLLAERGMTLTELSKQVGVTVVNLSILKNGRAKAIRFTTLTSLCEALKCQPGDLLSFTATHTSTCHDGNGGDNKD